MMIRYRLAASIATAACLLLAREGGATVEAYTWADEAGKALADAQGACSGDRLVRTVIQGERIWTVCGPLERYPGGSLASLDPAARKASVRWPFPKDHGPTVTLGLATKGSDVLGLLYCDDLPPNGSFWMAAAGPKGWVIPPTSLGAATRPLGLSFLEGRLAALFVPKSLQDKYGTKTDPKLVTVGQDGKMTSRTFPLATMCKDVPACLIMSGLPEHGGSKWRFLALKGQASWRVDEKGQATRGELKGNMADLGSFNLTAAGLVLNRAVRLVGVLGPEGLLQEPPKGPAAMLWGGHYRAGEASIALEPRWRDSSTTPCLLPWGKGHLQLQCEGESLQAQLISGEKRERLPQTMVPQGGCAPLENGALVERKGGTWLVAPEGLQLLLGEAPAPAGGPNK